MLVEQVAEVGAGQGFLERRLVNRDFARLWTGMAVSGLGDAVFDTTVLLWIATVLAQGRSWGPRRSAAWCSRRV